MNQFSQLHLMRDFTFRNLANIVSVLGVLPLGLLFLPDAFVYIIPFLIYNNFMDDLDGIVAKKLKIGSRFGANLDNVCDGVAHVLLTLMVGAHFGGMLLIVSMIASGAVILRIASRLEPGVLPGIGSPTNELMRHVLFVLLLTQQLGYDPVPFLVPVFLLHSISMLAPFKMTALIRGRAKSTQTVLMVNAVLLAAWLVPTATPLIAFAFIGTYLYAFTKGWVAWVSIQRSTVSSTADLIKKADKAAT